MTDKLATCYSCGALVKDIPGTPHKYIGATAGCWEIYGEILAKEFGEYGYPEPTNRLTVDTYAVQHPGKPGRRAIQSVSGHLVSLHLVLEEGWSGPVATRAIAQILKQADQFIWLEPPSPSGHITVLDVVKANSLPEHEQLVLAWARDVWQAWAAHHVYVRDLVRQYLR